MTRNARLANVRQSTRPICPHVGSMAPGPMPPDKRRSMKTARPQETYSQPHPGHGQSQVCERHRAMSEGIPASAALLVLLQLQPDQRDDSILCAARASRGTRRSRANHGSVGSAKVQLSDLRAGQHHCGAEFSLGALKFSDGPVRPDYQVAARGCFVRQFCRSSIPPLAAARFAAWRPCMKPKQLNR